jgi:hypothetical protein
MSKKLFNYGTALLLLAFVLPIQQSCTNLDERVYSQLTDANFPLTEEQFIAALGASYTSLYALMQHNSYFSLQEISSDEAMIPQRGGDWFDGGQWIRVHSHRYTPNEEAIDNGWNYLYGGVNNCNRVIDLFTELLESGSVSEEEAGGFIAEVRTLRALFYFWLMDAYGNVPIVTSFKTSERNPANKTRAEVYAFIESELNESVPLLNRAKDVGTYARMNYWSGKALQAKLYLNAGVYTGTPQWQKCIDACDEIIDSGLYELEGNYFTNFNTDNIGSRENIFAIPYNETQAEGFNLPQMTLHYQSQFTFDLQQQPWNGYCTVQEFYNSYEDTDGRKGEWGNQKVRGNFLAGPQYAVDGVTQLTDSGAEAADPDGPGIVFTPLVNAITGASDDALLYNPAFPGGALRQDGARIGKFEFAIGATPNLSNHFPVLRYADILLSKAEALHRSGGSSTVALGLVNDVRARAGGVAPFGSLTDESLLAERGREMFYEGWRRQDLIRFGAYGGTWNFKPASTPEKELFPIPANQINANPNLRQNTGY